MEVNIIKELDEFYVDRDINWLKNSTKYGGGSIYATLKTYILNEKRVLEISNDRYFIITDLKDNDAFINHLYNKYFA